MLKIRRIYLTSIVLILLPATGSAVDDASKLAIYTEHFPPYSFLENDQVDGINIQLVKALCTDAQIDCDFTLLPWKRAMREMLKAAPSGIVSTARTAKREQQFHWVGPLSSSVNCVYRLAERNDIVVETHTDLANYKMAISNDSVFLMEFYDIGFKSGTNLFAYPGKFMSLKPFSYGRVDLILGSRNTINKQVEHMGLTVNDIAPIIVLNDFYHVGNYLALHRDTPSNIVTALKASAKRMLTLEYKTLVEEQFLQVKKAPNVNKVNQTLWDRCVKAE